MIYLDSCALVKLLLPEAETGALRAFLSEHRAKQHFTSALALTEVPRAAIRVGADAAVLDAADRMLTGITRIRLTEDLLREAGRHPGPTLRSLDAIHLVTANRLRRALDAFITYDHRLAKAATAADLPVCVPA